MTHSILVRDNTLICYRYMRVPNDCIYSYVVDLRIQMFELIQIFVEERIGETMSVSGIGDYYRRQIRSTILFMGTV